MNLLDPIQGEALATEGLARAVNKADRDHPDWSERCWNLFLRWLGKKPVGFHFMVEMFREDLVKHNMIEMPHSNRAFGFISRRATSVTYNLIESAGKAKTKSKTGHRCNAEVWKKI